MLSRAQAVLRRIPQPWLLVGGVALASALAFARRHPAGTMGARGRAPPPSESEFEVRAGFPSTHMPIPEIHTPASADPFENALGLGKAAVAAEAAAKATADALRAAADDDEALLVADELMTLASHTSPVHEPAHEPAHEPTHEPAHKPTHEPFGLPGHAADDELE